MKTTVNLYNFRDFFKKMNRENNFSYEGLEILYRHLTELEEDTDEEIELDIIALCCDYTEYESFEKIQEDYNDIKSIEELEKKTIVMKFENGTSNGYIIQNF